MEEEKRNVIFLPEAENNIFCIFYYIVMQGYSEAAEKFYNKLYDFGYTLNNFPKKHPICRYKKFGKRKMRCAVFHKNYIFVYKIVGTQIVIYNVIHTKTLR